VVVLDEVSRENNKTLRGFVVYCPNPSTGVFLVYFLLKRDHRCPRIAFVQDLGRAVLESQEVGDRVIIMLDGSMDMRESPLSLELKARGLEEKILKRHGTIGPATF
jgi:hypothetical protein